MNMIASVLHLDRKAVKALRVTDAYSLHRVVYSLYEDVRDYQQKSSSNASGILYADQGGDVYGRKILMLADRSPKNSVGNEVGEVRSKEIPEDFLDFEQYRFKVVVNPTRRNNQTRKLIPVKGRQHIAQWFAERAPNSWGFEVSQDHLQVNKVEVQQFNDKNKRKVTISQAHIQGVLTVVEKEKFVNSFTAGIGRARTYGCGLMQIVPISPSHLNND